MIYRVDVEATAPVCDTEVTDRVVDAVTNLFPGGEVERGPGEVRVAVHSLDHFSELLHRQEILDSARSAFLAGRRGDGFSFALKKQAAFCGVVNFVVGEAGELGDIHVRVRVNEPTVEKYVAHVAPPTEDGNPIVDET